MVCVMAKFCMGVIPWLENLGRVSIRPSGLPKILGECAYSVCCFFVCLIILERFRRFVAVKVQTIDTNHLIRSNILEDEFALLDRIRSVKLDHPHPGKGCIVPILDHFRLDGFYGVHTCLTFPVLGPSLAAFLYALRSKKVNYELVKRFTTQLLLALAYLHDECRIVHTGKFATTLHAFVSKL